MEAFQETDSVRYYIILLIKDTLIYRVANNLLDVHDRLVYDAELPEVIPLGYCSSADWTMEWYVGDEHEFRRLLSAKVLELINYIRQNHPA